MGVVGLGYVGLPLLVEKAKVGFRVVGNEIRAQDERTWWRVARTISAMLTMGSCAR